MTVVPNHRKDVDMYLLLILDLSGKKSGHSPCLNISGNTATVRGEVTKEREGRDRRDLIQSQNASCSTLINLISAASKDS